MSAAEERKEAFRSAVKAYITLHDEISKSAKQMRELRKQKDKIGEIILEYMKERNVDQCDLSDGKLMRKKSKRTEGLKKEYILNELIKLTGNPQTAEAALNNMNSMRMIKETEILSRTTLRVPVNSMEMESDDEL